MTRDYYSVLKRATSALAPNTEQARGALYDRARHAIVDAGFAPEELRNEQASLEAAIDQIEREAQQQRWLQRRAAPIPVVDTGSAPAEATRIPKSAGWPVSWRAMVAIGALSVLIAVAAVALWPRVAAERSGASKRAAAPATRVAADKSDVRSTDPKRSFIFNRQVVYYRTVHPTGTIVIAKSQRFLYLVRPNQSAIRYTVGVGRECANAVGLLLISAKEEWSQTAAPDAQPTGRRFGARSLALSDTGHRIHGTYAATTDGEDGCFPLVNDDIIDLYDRVAMGARVVIN